jgi:Ca2+-binding EF-hand superfamily protein
MDANKDGVVTKDELTTLLKGLGEDVTDDVVDEMIKIADENGDDETEGEDVANNELIIRLKPTEDSLFQEGIVPTLN